MMVFSPLFSRSDHGKAPNVDQPRTLLLPTGTATKILGCADCVVRGCHIDQRFMNISVPSTGVGYVMNVVLRWPVLDHYTTITQVSTCS